MSDLDPIIGSDFRALGEATRRALPDFDRVRERLLGAREPYRDGEAGAEARRDALRLERLRELALLPTACERTFVHRVSRAAAGAAMLAGVLVTALISSDDRAHGLVYLVLGQPTAQLTAALLGAAALAAYILAGLVAERIFERRVTAIAARDGDTYDDLEQLRGSGPLDEAHRLLDRVDAAALALPLAGIVSGGLVFGLLALFSDIGWSALSLVDASRDILVSCVAAGVVAGVVLGGAAARDRRALVAPLMRVAEHWATLVIGILAALAGFWYAVIVAFGVHSLGVIPDATASWLLGTIGLAGLLLPSAWLLARLRRREHTRLDR